MSGMDQELFDGKTLSDVFKDIYKNTDGRKKQIDVFIEKLIDLVHSSEEAVVIAPLVKDFINAGIKNNEHIVKVAQITQRIVSSVSTDSEGNAFLNENEKQQLISHIRTELDSVEEEDEKLKKTMSKVIEVTEDS